MKTVLAVVGGFFFGALVSWACCVFVLHLPWETSLLVIEIVSIAAAACGGIIALNRQRFPS